MNKLCFLVFFISSLGFTQTLEETIYVTTEAFNNNQNTNTLQILNKQESTFKDQVKTNDEQLALVFLQCHKGFYLFEQSKLKEAIITYEEALNRFNINELSKISDFDIIENCLNPLGTLYTKTGDYTNAENTIKQYFFLAEKSNNKVHQISGIINLAKLYQTIGKHETVITLTSSYFDKENINKIQKQKLIQLNVDSQIALGIISNYADIPKVLDNKAKYKIELGKGNYTAALIYFNKVKKTLFNNNQLSDREKANTYFQEAQLNYLLKKPDQAFKSLEKAIKALLPNFNDIGLPARENLYAEYTFIDIFDLYATLQTNNKKALEILDLSFYVSGLLQNNWTSQENKIQNQAANRIRSETCIDILFNEYNLTKNKDHIIKAFQYAEGNKATIIKEISQKKIQLQNYPNDSLLNKEFELLTKQEHITSLLIKEQLGDSKASNINTLSQQLSSISVQLKALKTAIHKKYPRANNTISIEQLQHKLLKDKAVLVEYFYGKNTLYQFIISEKDIILESIDLNEETKKSIINFIHFFDDASIINNAINKFTKQASKIYELLNFNGVKDHKNIIIIPDGLLNFIPFESLLTSETNTMSFSKMDFVVKKHIIAYNSSSHFYLINNDSSKNHKLLGIFPVFENSKQPLTFSIKEARTIENEMDSKLLLKEKATKKYFIENANKYGILHLSTHASSGDFVIPAHIEFYDDTLFLHELYSLNLKNNLVVLSACETGVGKLYKGEAPMSIARGFQYAGAKNLLFSLWQINDLSTSRIMQSFYENYKTYNSIYIANQYSKIDYLQNESISNAKKSPYYWSPFVFYGELSKPISNNILFYIFIGIAITLFVVFLTSKLKTCKIHFKNFFLKKNI